MEDEVLALLRPLEQEGLLREIELRHVHGSPDLVDIFCDAPNDEFLLSFAPGSDTVRIVGRRFEVEAALPALQAELRRRCRP